MSISTQHDGMMHRWEDRRQSRALEADMDARVVMTFPTEAKFGKSDGGND
jgi:hypothetical protein